MKINPLTFSFDSDSEDFIPMGRDKKRFRTEDENTQSFKRQDPKRKKGNDYSEARRMKRDFDQND